MKLLNILLRSVLISILLALPAISFAQTAIIAHPTPATGQVLLRFAILGDAEPKPEPKFPHLQQAVIQVNQMAASSKLDFVVGVGDIAHKGTEIQYQNVTPVLQQLQPAFYPIMGNEEHGSTIERFLNYANLWNQGKATFTAPSYVLEFAPVVLIFASPDHGRDFADSGINWIKTQLQKHKDKPVMLVVHGAQQGVYPENADKGISHPGFADIIAQPNLVAVISGDLHMDMDRVQHSKKLGKVHYLHIPALERTKIPDETRHTAMFRVITFTKDQLVIVDTYQIGNPQPLSQHDSRFALEKQFEHAW